MLPRTAWSHNKAQVKENREVFYSKHLQKFLFQKIKNGWLLYWRIWLNKQWTSPGKIASTVCHFSELRRGHSWHCIPYFHHIYHYTNNDTFSNGICKVSTYYTFIKKSSITFDCRKYFQFSVWNFWRDFFLNFQN